MPERPNLLERHLHLSVRPAVLGRIIVPAVFAGQPLRHKQILLRQRRRVRAMTTARSPALSISAKAANCPTCPAERPPAAKRLNPAAPATADRVGDILMPAQRERKLAKKSTVPIFPNQAAGCPHAPPAAERPPKSPSRRRKRASALSANRQHPAAVRRVIVKTARASAFRTNVTFLTAADVCAAIRKRALNA